MGHPVVRTPNLDRLASESLVFPRGYVPSSLCRPSLASIITGLYPHQHEITGNDPAPPAGIPLREARRQPQYRRQLEHLMGRIERLPTLPRLLAEKGYLSHQSGKWWEGHYSRGGFTHGMTHGDPDRGGRHGDEGLRIGREGMDPIFAFIEEAGDRPFFIWYAPFLPHTPHDPPERLLERYRTEGRPIELARYYAMVEWLDETVGRLLEYLESKDLARDTMVLYLADNGWIQRTAETPLPSGWNQPFAPRSKRSAEDGGIRTPILVRRPGKVEPRRLDKPASSIDLAPTILAAAGLQPRERMHGVNLLNLQAVNRREAVFGDVYLHDIQDLDDPVASLTNRWVIQDRWKLIVPHWPNRIDAQLYLYDLQADPYEKINLALDAPRQVRRLLEMLNAWFPVN